MKRLSKGFTLIEMSIVLIVISLILAGVLKTVGVQRQQLKRDETRQQLETIKQALIGFAATEGRLPCPDTDNDGEENPVAVPNTTPCTSDEGFLPYIDLEIGNEDAWGSRFRYRVTGSGADNFADEPAPGLLSSFTMAQTGDIRIEDAGTALVANNVPAVVISYAENGRQTINSIICAAGIPSATEDENCNDDTTFVYDDYRTDYDDLVVWIPQTVLKNRMIEAGRLALP